MISYTVELRNHKENKQRFQELTATIGNFHSILTMYIWTRLFRHTI